MLGSSRSAPKPIPDSLRNSLKELRQGLLNLHKALIVSEQITYERIYGRIASSGQLLQLVMNDPWFAWLHPLSHLVVRIDVVLEDPEDISLESAQTLLADARAMLRPSEEGDGFERSYYEALQRTPDVVLAHAGVKKLLSTAVLAAAA
ncbi:MAG: hypothetical protein L6Q34_02200 [Nitrospira sp.]|nr:MAG: hypothetical protein UZ03_NOB001002774 [Nitrospira sp. OLB3]MCE7965566.1 hypothetical protein [Nitrospira sp. NTP2]MCK6492220.1 hypothetical protein [Nitrospira sp.]MEB2339062.1 hypothetical protein [Nitrospirales bacterium]MCK6499373.1 hypothetical protein [Nitrospira sp.]